MLEIVVQSLAFDCVTVTLLPDPKHMFYNFWRLAFTTQTFRVLHKPNFLTQLQKTPEDNKMEKQPVPQSLPQPCKLDMRVHEFISLICNIDMMQNMMTEIGETASDCLCFLAAFFFWEVFQFTEFYKAVKKIIQRIIQKGRALGHVKDICILLMELLYF
jgi:hypothetical protein